MTSSLLYSLKFYNSYRFKTHLRNLSILCDFIIMDTFPHPFEFNRYSVLLSMLLPIHPHTPSMSTYPLIVNYFNKPKS